MNQKKIYLSEHAWKRYRKRYPEHNALRRRDLDALLNQKADPKDVEKALNRNSETILKIMGMYCPVVSKGRYLVVKTIIPPWLFENDIERLKKRVDKMESMISRQRRTIRLLSFVRCKILHNIMNSDKR